MFVMFDNPRFGCGLIEGDKIKIKLNGMTYIKTVHATFAYDGQKRVIEFQDGTNLKPIDGTPYTVV